MSIETPAATPVAPKAAAGLAEAAAMVDPEERARAKRARLDSIGRWVMPVITILLGIVLWDRVVAINEIPHYILPGPGRVLDSLINDWGMLSDALMVTLQITFLALIIAATG